MTTTTTATMTTTTSGRGGWLAEFDTPEALLAAARAASDAGHSLQAYAPHHVEGLAEAVAARRPPIAAITFCGALLGGLGGYAMQWFSAVVDRPLDVGGRPLHSAPMFIPVTFETTVLCAALAALVAFLWTAGLPRLRHPLFDVPGFERATRDRYFLVLLGEDTAAMAAEAATALDGSLRPVQWVEVGR